MYVSLLFLRTQIEECFEDVQAKALEVEDGLSRLHRNSTGGTGTHSAGKLTKTEVSGKEGRLIVREGRGQASCLLSFSQISVLLLVVNLFYLFTSNKNKSLWLGIAHCTWDYLVFYLYVLLPLVAHIEMTYLTR
jgi:hypothetical protein